MGEIVLKELSAAMTVNIPSSEKLAALSSGKMHLFQSQGAQDCRMRLAVLIMSV